MQGYAVLTGDIIASRGADPAAVDRAFAVLRAGLTEIDRDWARIVSPLDLHRGDGWQCAIADPALGLRVALALIARLAAAEAPASRIAIGLGAVEVFDPVTPGRSRGHAFIASGLALDGMARDTTLALAGAGIGPRDAIIADLLSAHVARWSVKQAAAAALALQPDPPTLLQIGKALGVTAQSIDDRLTTGATKTVVAAVTDWEAAYRRGAEP